MRKPGDPFIGEPLRAFAPCSPTQYRQVGDARRYADGWAFLPWKWAAPSVAALASRRFGSDADLQQAVWEAGCLALGLSTDMEPAF